MSRDLPSLPPEDAGAMVRAERPDGLNHDRLIDREEFARRLSVGVSTLDRLRAAGQVGPRAIKFGGVRFLLAEVAAWLATPAVNGELHDATTWPSIWESLRRRAEK